MQDNSENSSENGETPECGGGTNDAESRMDDFTQFQLKEYDNVSQAHFKTNEVLATFYRYYILITAIPITTISLAVVKLSENGIGDEGRILAHFVFGISALLLGLFGAAVISYIEGLRLDAILYARVVNSIRDYFFRKPGADLFGAPVLPTDRYKPSYDGFGSANLMYHACALMNSVLFGAGILVLLTDRAVPLADMEASMCNGAIVGGFFLFLMVAQVLVRRRLAWNKSRKGF